jgi:SWI/SNF-related matrix-associated actin-dependent regulator of chromatin subfamily A member 5
MDYSPYLLPNSEPEPVSGPFSVCLISRCGLLTGKWQLETGEQIVLASSKLVFLDRYLAQLLPKGHRVLIFSQWIGKSSVSVLQQCPRPTDLNTGMLNIVEDYMRLRGHAYARLDGQTSRPRRTLDMRLFQQENSRKPFFFR